MAPALQPLRHGARSLPGRAGHSAETASADASDRAPPDATQDRRGSGLPCRCRPRDERGRRGRGLAPRDSRRARKHLVAQATATERPSLWERIAPRDLLQPRNLIILVVVVVIAYLAIVPLAYLLWGTFFDENGLTLRFFEEAYDQIPLNVLLANSFTFAIGSTVLAVTLGTTLAYLQARTDVPFKRLIFAASLVPLIIPGILHTIAWILLFSPEIGVFNAWLEPIFGPRAFNIYSMQGMILIEGLHLSPLVFLLMSAAFHSMDPSLEESALMSGAPMRTVARRITLPLVLPALSASILVMMVRVLESFEVAAIVGRQARIPVFVSRIFD
ncbi:MAG: iron ABC transporter permease, partial [Actinobacteria bacterium]|nr:iron ABC transporter permease [Actinomycetota bacterium]